ncbi:MAG TPA: ferrous iron transport protein B [Anaerolineae bacterium]|nr:ferrous iron transport protein B [Anaerolineae bacterium]
MTGAHQRVGNYPGVTVERREGVCRVDEVEVDVVDLPGTYSLTAYSIEERIARDAILDPDLDVVINVVDASNADRNFYLTTQLLEIGKPLVVALNMSDVARASGVEWKLDPLSALLSAPVVETVGHRGRGVAELLRVAVERARASDAPPPPRLRYGEALDAALDTLCARPETTAEAARLRIPPRWLALKLLEEDESIARLLQAPALQEAAKTLADPIAANAGDRIEALTADARYGFVSGVCHAALRQTAQVRHTNSDRIDAVVTHWLLGIPIFLLMMFAVFRFTFALGEPMMGVLEGGFEHLGLWIGSRWPEGSDSLLRSLLVDGVIGGVGGVVTFLPNILLLFFAISLLEDSGYMARAAFVTDHLMRKFGLQGRSFIPMLLGFGCTVPGILATRTLEQGRARLATILVLPLMSCGARLTIYALIIPAFFPRHLHARILWTVYVAGIVAALALARLLRWTVLRGESHPLVIELPPYRWPTLRGALLRMVPGVAESLGTMPGTSTL